MVWLWGGGFGLPCQRICLCGHACKWDVNTILILDNVISYAWTFSKFWGFSTEFKLKLILYKIIFGVHFFSLAFSDPSNIFLNWFITYLSDSTKDMFSINVFFQYAFTFHSCHGSSSMRMHPDTFNMYLCFIFSYGGCVHIFGTYF